MIYLAAPFFNTEQLRLVQDIEAACDAAGAEYFSPRLIHGPKPVPIKDEVTAERVFAANVDGLMRCDTLLAVADWLMPAGSSVQFCRHTRGIATAIYPIKIPDTGVVFEVGYVKALNDTTSNDRTIALYTDQPAGSAKLNIMLTQAAAGVVYGMEHLRRCLCAEGLQRTYLQPYEGRHT